MARTAAKRKALERFLLNHNPDTITVERAMEHLRPFFVRIERETYPLAPASRLDRAKISEVIRSVTSWEIESEEITLFPTNLPVLRSSWMTDEDYLEMQRVVLDELHSNDKTNIEYLPDLELCETWQTPFEEHLLLDNPNAKNLGRIKRLYFEQDRFYDVARDNISLALEDKSMSWIAEALGYSATYPVGAAIHVYIMLAALGETGIMPAVEAFLGEILHWIPQGWRDSHPKKFIVLAR